MEPTPTASPDAPFVPASRSLPEITFKAVVLGAILAAVLAAANAYLGLFAGMTVSASIPAAVISMAILRMFRESNILENNIVQTSASAGESLAAGAIFTLPALILMGVWSGFSYWETTLITGLGGIVGVLFTIPLRRALIVEQPLRFPEGVATAEVLKVGEGTGAGVRYLAAAALLGALFKLGTSGIRLWGETVEGARRLGASVGYVGTNVSPALVAVGYIVGLEISVLMFIGGAFNWWVAIPALAASGVGPEGVAAGDLAWEIWSSQTRYLGVGAMVVGGLWALVSLRSSLVSGIRSGIAAYRSRKADAGGLARTELDTPMQWVAGLLVLALIPLYVLFQHFTGVWWVSAVMAVLMLVAGFLFAAVAGYMAGLVGSSNNPISGVTIATILTSALILLALLGSDSEIGPAAAIFIGAVVCCAAAIAGDNMQDLKAGYLVGATPFKQQIMQMIGVVAAALVMAPILMLILQAYGIGEPTATHPEPLTAPQATLMASVADGVFGAGLPKGMVFVGMLLAAAVIVLDEWLRATGASFRTPVLAVAVGLYLPLELEVPILLGGLLAWGAARVADRRRRSLRRRGGQEEAAAEEVSKAGERHGLLFAAGLITGEALLGILLAIPIVIAGERDVLAIFGGEPLGAAGDVVGLALLAVVMFLLYRVAVGPASERT